MPRSNQERPNGTRKSSRSLRAKGSAERAAIPSLVEGGALSAGMPAGRLPVEVSRQAQREMDRLRRLPSGSPEAGSTRAYLQWLWSMPWDRSSPEDAHLKHVETVLEQEHLALAKAKERIMEYLAVRRLKPDLPGPALCLVGPPGTGKSSLAATVAKALGRPWVRVSITGTTSAAELLGVPRAVPGGQPGKIARAIRDAGVRNPVLVVDGVDRLIGEAALEVSDVLLELLDPEQSAHFTDQYLGLPCDLSHAVLILCANTIELVPDPLLERLEVIEVPSYSEDEKLAIVQCFLIPRALAEHGLAPRDLSIGDEALRAIVRHYTLEAGVRALSRQIATICRKIARSRASNDGRRHSVTVENLEDYLGHRVYAPEMAGKDDEVGVAAGLAWTAAGGEVLVVEALKMPGSGRVVTTGQLGEVMRESVQAAHSYVRSRADLLEIEAEAFSNFDIHIHFPAGGVPKDGPSAGITVGLVIASVLSDRPIRHDIAMTGEVSLRGKVLLVGGIREKALATYRAGFRAMMFPAANVKDVGDIPEDVRQNLELIPVESMDEVFRLALHRVIVPQRMAGNFVIEVEEEEAETPAEEHQPARAAKPGKRARRRDG